MDVYQLYDNNVRGEYATQEQALHEVQGLINQGRRHEVDDLYLARVNSRGDVHDIAHGKKLAQMAQQQRKTA